MRVRGIVEFWHVDGLHNLSLFRGALTVTLSRGGRQIGLHSFGKRVAVITIGMLDESRRVA